MAAAPVVASAVTRAMEFYADKVWIDGVSKGLDHILPPGEHGLIYMLLYALALTLFIVVVKQGIEYLLATDSKREDYYHHLY